jgi:lipopolysaccharide export system permease protein
MKKLIFKKILLDITFFFLLVSLSLTLIVWVIQAVNYLDFVTEDGHSLKVYFSYTILSLPKIFNKILPFIIFVSTFYIITVYEKNNELVIFWTYGISKINFINIIFQFSIFFIVLKIFLSIFLVPLTQEKARSFIKTSSVDFFPQLLKEKKFIDTVSDLTIFIDSKNNNGELKNIFLKEKISEDIFKVIYAKNGLLVDNNNMQYLMLQDGIFMNYNNKKNTFFKFKNTEFNLSEYSSKSTTYPKIQERKSLQLLECFFSKKIKNKNFSSFQFNCDENSINSVTEELARRIIMPFYIPVTLILSSLLIFRSSESINYIKFKMGIFLLTLIIIIFSEIMIRYVGLSNFHTILFSIAPFTLIIFSYLLIFLNINKWKHQNK